METYTLSILAKELIIKAAKLEIKVKGDIIIMSDQDFFNYIIDLMISKSN